MQISRWSLTICSLLAGVYGVQRRPQSSVLSMDELGSPQLVSPRPRSRWRRMVRYLALRVMRMQATPRAIARGIAAGAFSGLFPFFGLQIIIAVALCVPLRGNKIAAAAATWISNPFTYVPIYLFNLQVGQWILGQQQPFMPAAAKA